MLERRTTSAFSLTKLVLAFDVGTTYSGISYGIIVPGKIPQIHGVTRFPAQMDSSSKIPSIIYYDTTGAVKAIGAEAIRGGIEVEAEDNKWSKAEWFKLHISSTIVHQDREEQSLFDPLPPLPPNKTVTQILADLYRYLLECAGKYIRESHENGALLWSAVKDDIDFVLSHPNGWKGSEQKVLRDAAILAGLIPNCTPASENRISFVTEGEASLHFVIRSGTVTASLQSGDGVLIVDAGGGTVDISSYKQMSDLTAKLAFEEIAAPDCRLYGSLLVDRNAKAFLEDFLRDSSYIMDVNHIVACFNKTCKPTFKLPGERHYIKFGTFRDNDAVHGIREGHLALAGSDVAGFFKPSATAIKQAILEQRSTASKKIVHVVLVGGFAASDYLFDDLDAFLGRTDPTLRLIRPKERASKAVADGAISFYLDHFVRARLARTTVGAICSVRYNPTNLQHVKRCGTKFIAPSGEARVPEAFCVILSKNTCVLETTEFRQTYNQVSFNRSYFERLSTPVWCYLGKLSAVGWKDTDLDNFVKLCTIEADLSDIVSKPMRGDKGKAYYRVDYDIVLLFGLTELKAQVAWDENGIERRSPAEILYEVK